MTEIEKLEHLSLVSKICTELENHLGLNDKDLAEFIIDLADKNPTLGSFKTALEKNGAEFDDSLVANLLRLIQHMKPKKKDNKYDDDDLAEISLHGIVDKEIIRTKLPVLALPDDPTHKLMSELENLIPKWSNTEIKLKEEIEEEIEEKFSKTLTRQRSYSRSRSRSRSANRSKRKKSRSRSPRRKRSRSRSRDRSNRRHQRRRSRSRSTSYDRRRNQRRSRSRSMSNGHRRGNTRRKEIDEMTDDPIVGRIYRGQVSSIRDFGCFVQIFGIRKKMEGLVHISQLKKERVANVGDVVKRSQKVRKIEHKPCSFPYLWKNYTFNEFFRFSLKF